MSDAPQVGPWATSPLPSGGAPQGLGAGDKISTHPQVDGLTTSPLLCRGFPNSSKRETK